MSQYDTYQTSLTGRYCSPAMSQLFSQRSRHSTWRKLWFFLAKSQKELGIETITADALAEMEAHLTVTDADFDTARIEEKKRRHDVMAHVHAYSAVAPSAAGIIHYGATSCFVTDNTELILMRDALDILLSRIAKLLNNLIKFAMKWKAEPTLSWTHLQAAQLQSVGKRASQWAQDLMFDLENIEQVRENLKFRGAQGTTGTQASFLEIFGGDSAKCDELNKLLCQKAGFKDCYPVSSQTYSRKIDLMVANAVAGLGSTAQKICGDIRLLANWKEIEEPFETSQIGSSAMAYKRNPMRCERICSLSRALLSKPLNFANTFADQWLMFLLADAILLGMDNVTDGLVVYPQRIRSRVQEELPFMITESIIMKLVAKGESRQEAHEQIRVLSHEAGYAVKHEGKPNDLVSRIKNTEFFKPVWDELDDMLRAELYMGRSVEIVERFCGGGGIVEEKLKRYKSSVENLATAQLAV
ncbi:L-Aspartase-like protein [Phialemonium atrogriseum]|uniref:Adenylosuccinate lyase n=1 Tax=Phialemonium atrogriseum TaxID=1093897 RepID=A0AAJ0FFM1_9PEZI|nr:L-Aspartase-like protein [Phialemonium atrogriseum]KAK1765642.1 L-Aspartase-like protein [Phialemonium atrogriseum]